MRPVFLLVVVLLLGIFMPDTPVFSEDLKISRLNKTPDLMQTDSEAKLPYGGAPYCGPVAASNAMVWLSNVGFPKLSQSMYPTVGDQAKLVAKLAIFMKTTRLEGTTVDGLMDGVDGYVKSCGYHIKSITYQGWENCHVKYASGIKKPRIEDIFDAMHHKSAVWLKVGWYRYIPYKNQYKRFAGHWLNVVYADQNNNSNPSKFILVHDSAKRSGKLKKKEKVTFEKIVSGTIVTGHIPPFKAQGMYKLGSELKVKSGADLGILDGIVILKMQ